MHSLIYGIPGSFGPSTGRILAPLRTEPFSAPWGEFFATVQAGRLLCHLPAPGVSAAGAAAVLGQEFDAGLASSLLNIGLEVKSNHRVGGVERDKKPWHVELFDSATNCL
jgi:hypothetical protein